MESTAAAPVVQTTVSDHIALVTLSNPPVNALSTAVRQGLQQAITALNGNADVHAIVTAATRIYRSRHPAGQ